MAALLEARDLVKTFGNGVRAVDGVSLTVGRGETLGLVGESGCGKSTTARLLLRLLPLDGGTLEFDGVDLGRARGRELRELRARLQVVPQNPRTSLNPRLSVEASVEFNLRVHGVGRGDRGPRVAEALERVGLPRAYARRYPHELSGGQLQRVAIARALVTEPTLIVCDEAVSALDKSIQAQILNLLTELQRESGISYVFISHDLAVVEHISDRIAVMYLGRVVEEADGRTLWTEPRHPYTRALLSAAPGSGSARIVLTGDPPSPADPPSGCTFRTRCPIVLPACAGERPPLDPASDGAAEHRVACINQSPAELLAAV